MRRVFAHLQRFSMVYVPLYALVVLSLCSKVMHFNRLEAVILTLYCTAVTVGELYRY